MIRGAVMKVAVQAEPKSINIPPAGAVTALQQEPAVQTAHGALGMPLALQQRHARHQANPKQEQHARADIKQEP